MARKVRVSYPGAIYHVMARGNERARIFLNDGDGELFLRTLEEGLAQFEVFLHGYCLMPNHLHLILETPEGNLPRFMAWLQTTFTLRYNRRRRRVGHLFQGRYRAELVEDVSYGKWLLLYVHLNPVRNRKRGVVHYISDALKKLRSFRWSSHRAYGGLEQPKVQGLRLEWLAEWGKNETNARKRYLEHIEGTVRECDPLDWKERVEKGLAVGGEPFIEKLVKLLKGKGKEVGRETHSQWKNERRRSLLAAEFKKEKDDRNLVWLRVRLLGERPIDLARAKGYFDGGTIIQIVKRVEARAQKDPALRSKLDHLVKVSSVTTDPTSLIPCWNSYYCWAIAAFSPSSVPRQTVRP